MARVVVTRSGGFAGLVRTGELDLDDATAARWQQALAAVGPGGSPRPDAFVYEVSVGESTAVVDEPSMPEDLRRMVSELFAL